MTLNNKDKQGIALIILSSIALLLLAITPLILKKQAMGYDPTTFCVKHHDTAHTVFLVDKTDALSITQRDALKQKINQIKQGLQPREKLSLYILDHTNYIAPTPIFSKCNPGTGQQANEIYQNPAKVQHQFDEFFGKPLDDALQALTTLTTSPTSPIVEMLNEMALLADFSAQHPRRLILISDLLQNMPKDSHYQAIPHFEAWQATHKTPPLWHNTTVEMIYLRQGHSTLQGADHLHFWQQYFTHHGARLEPVSQVR